MRHLTRSVLSSVLAFVFLLGELWEKGHPPAATSGPGMIAGELQRVEQALQLEHTHEERTAEFDLSLRGASGRGPTPPTGETSPQPPRPPDLSLVLPVYNEGPRVKPASHALLNLHDTSPTELIAVDDCSVDDTVATLASVKDTRLKILRATESLGYSGAVRQGMLQTTGHYVVVVDTPLAGEITTLQPLLSALKTGASIALLSRFEKPCSSKLLTWIFHSIYNVYVADFGSPCVALRGDFARLIAEQSIEGHFLLNALHYAAKHNLGVANIHLELCAPQYRERHVAHVGSWELIRQRFIFLWRTIRPSKKRSKR